MPIDPATLQQALGVAQTVYGAISGNNAQQGIEKAMAKRKAFVTPDEVFKILNATQYNAQGDTVTRDFQMGQVDRAFANSVGTAQRLGADPNDLSALFDQKIQGILKVGEQFHNSNMQAFGGYLSALNVVAENKAAEQISRDNMLKDEIQAFAQRKRDATGNVSGGINTVLSGLSAAQQMDLYKQQFPNTAGASATGGVAIGNWFDTSSY